jgi:uncharacterized protein YicC (UPF0701 family)
VEHYAFRVKEGSPMDRTVGQHIQALEQKLNLLNARIMDESDRAKRNQLESALEAEERVTRAPVGLEPHAEPPSSRGF